MGGNIATSRAVALVGPYTTGKTTLLESLLFTAGTLHRRGAVADQSSLGDGSPEARSRLMGVEVNIANTTFLDEAWTILDCPGSVEFQQDTRDALMVADVAVVVVDPEPERAVMAAPLLKFLNTHAIPHMIFINKVDRDGTGISIRACLEALQLYSDRPLILREVPIRDSGQITGYVDLVSERAYHYKAGQASDLIEIPATLIERENEARQGLLEHLADYDDQVLEDLLNDLAPPKDTVYQDLKRDLAADLLVPVFFGAAEKDEGVRRLWKALRHEAPTHDITAARLGIADSGVRASVFKSWHGRHTGKLSLLRLWSGELKDGTSIKASNGESGKVSGLYAIQGQEVSKITSLPAGGIGAAGRLEDIPTGTLIGTPVGFAASNAPDWPTPLPPLFALALRPTRQGDDVKLTTALARLCEEDPSLSVEHNADTSELRLWGQGDIHLQVSLARLERLFHIDVQAEQPLVAYKETIRKGTVVQGRFKRQSGGHGQFGDVHLTIAPLPRGSGVRFEDQITGGVIPRQYIPAVEAGVYEWAQRGPLGFPVVDFAVALTDGSYHVVDSSEAAFKSAAGVALRDGVAQCDPVLLEPILWVEACVPADATSKAQRALSGRRGQILGFLPRDGWHGWDCVQAHVPQAEMHDLITELRSLTMGVGTFSWRFDHLREVTGKTADKVVELRAKALAPA